MKKITRYISAALGAFTLFFTVSGQAFAAEELDASAQVQLCNEPHNYEVTAESPEWAEMTLLDRLESCAVSNTEAENMSTPALVETVLEYPFIVNIYAYSSLEEGIATVCTYFPGLSELLARKDVSKSLQNYISNNTTLSYSIEELPFELIVANDLLSFCREIKGSEGGGSAAVLSTPTIISYYTPKNTRVEVFLDLTWDDHNTSQSIQQRIQLQYSNTYPSCVALGAVNPSYNCHSYAFCDQSITNRYWLNDPIAFITDGSYVETVNNGQSGYRAVYTYNGFRTHSAVTVSGGPRITVKSKWGVNGLFQHYVDDCPYAISGATIKYYKRA